MGINGSMYGAILEDGSCPTLNTIFFLYSQGKRCCVSINFLAKKADDSSFSRREDGESDLLDRALGLSLC